MGIHAWQYADYADFHADRSNLRTHIWAVPLFLIGNLFVPLGFVLGMWYLPIVGIGVSAAAMAAQGAGHKREANEPKPFTGPWNVIARIFVEQWVTFPRFVLSGGWRRAFAAAAD